MFYMGNYNFHGNYCECLNDENWLDSFGCG